MRPRTAVAVAALAVLLGGVIVVGLGVGDDVSLTERWISDTPRDNEANHHPIGVDPDGDVVVAPVAAVPGADTNVSDTACVLASLAPDDGAVLWRHGVPGEECMAHALTEPGVGDLDGDGTHEVAVATTEEAVVVLDGDNGTEQFHVSQPVYGYAPPVIADVHPTAGRELVASDIGGNVVLVHANGSVLWRRPLAPSFNGSASVWERPIVADVDGDDVVEVAVGARDGIALLNREGSVEWTRTGGARRLVAADVDGDDAQELFAGDVTTVSAIDGATREGQWQRDFEGRARFGPPHDGDGDGQQELYVGLPNGTAVALDAATGDTEWTTTVTTSDDGVISGPVAVTVEDGGTAVAVAARDGTVALLNATNGAELGAYHRAVPIWTHPTASDLDGDGTDELLVRYGDGRVVALGIDR